MADVEIKFEQEKREGIVPVGTYLADAAKRFGIRFEDVCIPEADLHYCSVVISSGIDLLSPETSIEKKYFETHERKTNERLACQTRLERSGEVVVMTEKKSEAPKTDENEATADSNEQFRKEFADMPLERKIANLVQLETIALGETVSFIINSPFKIGEKIMDVMAEFGFKKEEREREAVRPEEHKAKANDAGSKRTKKAEASSE